MTWLLIDRFDRSIDSPTLCKFDLATSKKIHLPPSTTRIYMGINHPQFFVDLGFRCCPFSLGFFGVSPQSNVKTLWKRETQVFQLMPQVEWLEVGRWLTPFFLQGYNMPTKMRTFTVSRYICNKYYMYIVYLGFCRTSSSQHQDNDHFYKGILFYLPLRSHRCVSLLACDWTSKT